MGRDAVDTKDVVTPPSKEPEDITQETTEETVEETVYGASSELVEHVEAILELPRPITPLKALMGSLHSADVADVIHRLSPQGRQKLIHLMRRKIDPEILTQLEDDVLKDVVESLGLKKLSEAIKTLDSDDAFYLIEDLDAEDQQTVLQSIPLESRTILEEVFSYPEDSAGRLMQREVVCVPLFWTIQQTLDAIRQDLPLPEHFYDVFVVDPRHCPVGSIPLHKLLRCGPQEKISDVLETGLKVISVKTDQEQVAQFFRHYGLFSAPVVDDVGRLLGMITVDDVVDVIEAEAEEDIMHLAGVSESDFHASVLKTSGHRILWLIVSMINVMISVIVISQFEASLKAITALAFFMPISAAMGGNAGLQGVTVIVRALTTKELREENTYRSLWKETNVGLINGIVFAVIFGFLAGFWSWNLSIGLVVGGALICNMFWAGFAGAALPIFLNRLGMDPAVSAGPLVTTITDVLGYATYLGLATIFLLS